jgi:hypothetical protein
MADKIFNLRSGKLLTDEAEGIILVMKEQASLCLTIDGDLFWADLTEFEFVDGDDHGDQVAPGDVIRAYAQWVEGPRQLRKWLKAD